MAVVLWSSSAEEDLENILVYYSEQVSAALSESIYTRIRTQVARLKTFPNRTRPGRVDGTREYVIERLPLVVVVSVDGDTVHVLSVIHTARKSDKGNRSNKKRSDGRSLGGVLKNSGLAER